MGCLLLIFSVLFGIFLVKFTQVKKYSELILIFSSSYLLGIVFYDLFPQIYSKVEYKESFRLGLFVLAGVFTQVLLTSVTQGIEHGHLHKSSSKENFPYGIFIGLFFHSFLEGIPIGPNNYKLIGGMMIHKVPEAIILYFFLSNFLKNEKKILFFIFIFSLSTPFGLWIGERFILKSYYTYLLAFVCGIFIHISTHILFESSDGKHRFKLSRLVIFLLGSLLSFLI